MSGPLRTDGADWHWARQAVRRLLVAVFQRIARGDPLPGLPGQVEDAP